MTDKFDVVPVESQPEEETEPVVEQIVKKERKKRVMTPEQKQACVERLAKARLVKQQNDDQRKKENPKKPTGRPAGKELEFSRKKIVDDSESHQKELEMLKEQHRLQLELANAPKKRNRKPRPKAVRLESVPVPEPEPEPLSSMQVMMNMIKRN